MNSMALSEMETMLLGLLFAGKQEEAVRWMEGKGWLKQREGIWKMNIEANEFAGKLERMNIDLPWKGPSGGVFLGRQLTT